ncbi:hypothetical protein BT93_A0829 [Corymbia citriodora subsp. variegata]|nr:hypothetical protein BT93_A0829 [Corymbia citriodora subsp. variegata]
MLRGTICHSCKICGRTDLNICPRSSFHPTLRPQARTIRIRAEPIAAERRPISAAAALTRQFLYCNRSVSLAKLLPTTQLRLFSSTVIKGRRRNCSIASAFIRSRVSCSMKSYKLSELTHGEVNSLKARPRIDFSKIFGVVNPIVDDIHSRGDAAVKEYTARFDKVELGKIVENVSDLPDPELDATVREAFDVAYDNIYAFHLAQKSPEKSIENMKGVRCKRVARSIGSVGLYVPGGTAVLPSTALMLAVPAQIAGCRTVVLATPPSQDGSICKEVLYCAKKAGVTHILKAGGAQAIAAMAWGTESCPKVEKIFGPGNQYVTAAKMILQNSEAMVSIDMPAGPSEVLVIADKYASPVHIAADLLSQLAMEWI